MKWFIWPALLALAGCSVGPDYKKPDLKTAAGWEGTQVDPKEVPYSVPVANEADLSRWWTMLDDSELQSLIDRALKSNLDLLTAMSRVREARQQEVVAGAAGLPHLNATGSAVKFHSNQSLASSFATGSASAASASAAGGAAAGSLPDTNITLYSVGFDASWEIDVFGGVRRSVEAAKARTEAAQWQVHDGQVTLTAEIAADYMNLRALQARLAILRSESKSQSDTLSLIAARRTAGFVTDLDVNQQQALLASSDAQIPQLVAQIRVMQHAIAVLLAEQPDALGPELETAAAIPGIPAQLPIGLPSDLLRRRPDVRAAERQLAAATAEEGVAIADLYPKFNLLGALSFTGNMLGTLLSASNFGQVGAAAISWPIFKGGQIRANIKAKEEEEKQAYYAYQKAVLGAVKDAEDALIRFITEQQRIAQLEKAVKFGQSTVALALQQYNAGLVTYVNVLTAQANLFSAQDQLAQSRQALCVDLVSLYKALGGGWQG